MAATYTQTQIDELSAAIATGILTVSYSGPPARTITYQSIAAMQAQLARMVASLDRAAGTRVTSRRAAYRKMGRS